MTNENRESIIAKIAALLDKTTANGASEAEAVAAATMAQKLMAKYHIETLDTGEELEAIDGAEFPTREKWLQCLVNTVSKHMCCKACLATRDRKSYMTVVGRDTDRYIAIKTIAALVEICKAGMKRTKGGNDYAWGFYKGVSAAMAEQCRALALIVPDDVNKTFGKMFPLARNYRPQISYGGNAEARAQGYNDGKTAASRQQLTQRKQSA